MTPAEDDYSPLATAYLARSREWLAEGSKRGLFYAAFELKCCVEARMAEYLEHLEPYRGRKVQPFAINANAKLIRRISAGETIAKLGFHGPDGLITTQYHTPVPDRLKRYCEKKIDELRHAQRTYRQPDDPWWEKTRSELTEAYRWAWVACQGAMMVPPLWSKNKKNTHPMVFDLNDINRPALHSMMKMVNQTMTIEVDYLDEPPAEWVCDL